MSILCLAGRQTSHRLSPDAQAWLCCSKISPGAKVPHVQLLLSTATALSDTKLVPRGVMGPKAHPAAGSTQMKASGASSPGSHYPEGEQQSVPESCSWAEGESCFPFELIAKELLGLSGSSHDLL